MSQFAAGSLDSDGEVQAALVVEQLERRRPDTHTHAWRVADLAVCVAELARLPDAAIRQIYWGALVHDIGELNVPAAVFETPGPLAAADRQSIGEHAAIGARWLATVPSLASLVPFARWHHERFDGKGYPDGRGGHEVPLTVALVGVCDSWDAMTQARPYRPAPRSFDDAALELREGAGHQWSRALVDWLLETVTSECEGRARAG